MLDVGISKEAGPSLWIMIPIITLLGITFVRMYSGISHIFLYIQLSPFLMYFVLGSFVSLQIIFGLVGFNILRNITTVR
ncbi:hypothetical protein [Massilibacterium senegalense]|uniref:hypothetical protein n=1 Tax=Massilibacterium senegalense TaxID=1632858 RepID=UPI00078302E8|nr:hypothetical protein [Massilibacterium senegalense]